MQTIGERFEEARKRKGISLSEASEATKIRSDFLRNIEQNDLGFDLPEIYKRGFVKIYANYLSLDTQSILADYSAQVLSTKRVDRKTGSSEFFGSMELKSDSEDGKKSHLGKISSGQNSNTADESAQEDAGVDKIFFVKTGLVVLGVLAFLFVIVGLIVTVLSGNNPEIERANSNNQPSAITAKKDSATAADSPDASGPETISLIASGPVYVLVKQRDNNEELVRKTLSEGETVSFTTQGPVDIMFTVGENLVIVKPDGERVRPGSKGTAKITIR